jgi:hypothetical protein
MDVTAKIKEIKEEIKQLNYEIDIYYARNDDVNHQLKINERNDLKIILNFLIKEFE